VTEDIVVGVEELKLKLKKSFYRKIHLNENFSLRWHLNEKKYYKKKMKR